MAHQIFSGPQGKPISFLDPSRNRFPSFAYHAVIRQLFHGKILPLATLREVIARDIFKKVGFGGLVIQCLIFEAPVVDSEFWYIVRISGKLKKQGKLLEKGKKRLHPLPQPSRSDVCMERLHSVIMGLPMTSTKQPLEALVSQLRHRRPCNTASLNSTQISALNSMRRPGSCEMVVGGMLPLSSKKLCGELNSKSPKQSFLLSYFFIVLEVIFI